MYVCNIHINFSNLYMLLTILLNQKYSLQFFKQVLFTVTRDSNTIVCNSVLLILLGILLSPGTLKLFWLNLKTIKVISYVTNVI